MRIRSGLVLLVAVGFGCSGKKSMPELDGYADVLKKDPKISADPNVKSCLDGDAKGCASAAGALWQSKVTGHQEAEAGAAAYALGCKAGDLVACSNFGGVLLDGKGVKIDVELGVRLLQQACDGKEGIGCTALGDVYADGKGTIVKDEAKAVTMWDRGCTLRDASGCDSVVEYYKKTQNSRKAVEYGVHACETVPGACYLPGLLLTTTGIDGNTDRERAKPLLRRACVTGGKPYACEEACNLGDVDLCGLSKGR